MSRNVILRCRVTEKEAELIKEKAERSRMKMSRFLRTAALEERINVYDMKALNELALQFQKIGVNINQISAMVNQTKTVYANDMESLNKEMKKMKNVMDNFLRQFERDNINNGE